MAVIVGFEAQLGASWEQTPRLLLEPMVTPRCSTTLGMSVSVGCREDPAKSSEMCVECNTEPCLSVLSAVLLAVQLLFLFLIYQEL